MLSDDSDDSSAAPGTARATPLPATPLPAETTETFEPAPTTWDDILVSKDAKLDYELPAGTRDWLVTSGYIRFMALYEEQRVPDATMKDFVGRVILPELVLALGLELSTFELWKLHKVCLMFLVDRLP